MSLPTSRDEFKEYCLRKLGKPVIDINIDDAQVEDRLDDALQYYRDYHFDGTEHIYLEYPVTQADKDNGYLTTTSNVVGVVGVFDIGDSLQTKNLFDIRYQIHLNDLFDYTSGRFAPYVMAMRQIETLEEIFVGKKPIRWNRHVNKLHIDMDWRYDVEVGSFIVVEMYRVVDPTTYTDVWSDRWLLEYAPALVQRQWGQNLSKFEGQQLPGGVTLNVDRIMNDAKETIMRLEDEMINSYSLPVSDLTG